MKLFSYVVARDYGFAPNPFFGVCTLATCKPEIRKSAGIGDWVIGTGSKMQNRDGQLVFAMCVSEAMTYDEYWSDDRFFRKRPNFLGSLKQAYGDNIYYRDDFGEWVQQHSHHSHEDGTPNIKNIRRDTKANRVIVGLDYIYWGGNGPLIPKKFRNYKGRDVCGARGHQCKFPEDLVRDFIEWLTPLEQTGCLGRPLNWPELGN